MLKHLVWENKIHFTNIVDKIAADSSNLIKTLSDYEKKIINFSSGLEDSESNKLKGDMFEVLSAIFFERMGDSPHVGINDYKPIALEDDYGVDAIGINAANTKVAIQVKFRSNQTNLISYQDLAKTFAYAIVRKWVSPEDKNSIYLFTNSNGVTPACKTVLGNRLVLIDRQVLTHYLDNNKLFWANFIKRIYLILKEDK